MSPKSRSRYLAPISTYIQAGCLQASWFPHPPLVTFPSPGVHTALCAHVPWCVCASGLLVSIIGLQMPTSPPASLCTHVSRCLHVVSCLLVSANLPMPTRLLASKRLLVPTSLLGLTRLHSFVCALLLVPTRLRSCAARTLSDAYTPPASWSL